MSINLSQWVVGGKICSLAQCMEMNGLGSVRSAVFKNVIVSYGLSRLLQHVKENKLARDSEDLKKICTLDNFEIRVSSSTRLVAQITPKDIVGVDMVEPRLCLKFIEPCCTEGGESSNATLGRRLEAEIGAPTHLTANNYEYQIEDKVCCHLLGLLVYKLFSCKHNTPVDAIHWGRNNESTDYDTDGPARKKIATLPKYHLSVAGSDASYTPLMELGFPSSISMLVEDLLKCGRSIDPLAADSACASLRTASEELRLLILEPESFLFDQNILTGSSSSAELLQFRKGKIYGRDKECRLISDSFCNVCSGKSEALFVSGYSGSGKTRLIESVIDSVNSLGGFVVMEKIDLMVQEPFSAVIALFNALCLTVVDRTTPQERELLVANLKREFSSDFYSLAQLLPNIYKLCPELSRGYVQTDQQMNIHSVASVLRRFAKTVSNKLHPAMLVLDDLQWSDGPSLELIETVFSGVKESSFFFVGSYRFDEVDSEHPIFDTMNKFQSSGIPASILNLKGLQLSDVNEMVSDALRMLPRLCKPLSELVLQNTQGNPFFLREFLKSLVDQKLLQYSMREKKWIWDASKIASQNNMLDVLSLLSSKMRSLTPGVQTALKVMACFGTMVNVMIARQLGSTLEFMNLLQHLDEAVECGIMTKNGEYFKFAHDKMQEAALYLIPIEEREQFHFTNAVLLHSVTDGEDLDMLVFPICDQLKKAQTFLNRQDSAPIDIVGLFIKAGSKALKQLEFPRARSYFSVAGFLCPDNCWDINYERCLQFFFLCAKSSYSCGFTEEAFCALRQILSNARCLKDKLNSYYMMASVHFDCLDGDSAFEVCSSVLSQLGVPLPHVINADEVFKLINKTSNLLKSMSDEEILGMKEADERFSAATKFYDLLALIAGVHKTQLVPICVCKLMQLVLENGVTEYAVLGFSNFAAMFCYNLLLEDIPFARRLGKLAMAFQKRYNLKDQTPILYATHYGYVGPFDVPFQKCADMHSIGLDHGLSIGDFTSAFVNPHFFLKSAFCSGMNLSKLLKDTIRYTELAERYRNSHMKLILDLYRETFSSLIELRRPQIETSKSEVGTVLFNQKFHTALQSFWYRLPDKFEQTCMEIFDKNGDAVITNLFSVYMLKFYRGVNLMQNWEEHNLENSLRTTNGYIKEMKQLAKHSAHNFKNKVLLLEAEVLSVKRKDAEAKRSYSQAIDSARQSKFIHEEGLAYELLAVHCMNFHEKVDAIFYFNRAKDCYSAWGSGFKVEFVERMIKKLAPGSLE